MEVGQLTLTRACTCAHTHTHTHTLIRTPHKLDWNALGFT